MPGAKTTKPDVITYGDHEILTPDTSSFRKLVRLASPQDDDPVARAEAALDKISGEFSTWMFEECDRLDAARHKIRSRGMSHENRQELFLAAHDVKGDAGTFGYPLVAQPAESLCRLLEHTPDPSKIPLKVIDQHVDAVRAIVREYARS